MAYLSDPNNVYAPFSCKIDWELARWAKLRGPGSTAVSDLLAIDGVANSYFILYHLLNSDLIAQGAPRIVLQILEGAQSDHRPDSTRAPSL